MDRFPQFFVVLQQSGQDSSSAKAGLRATNEIAEKALKVLKRS
jgi:hypothetical protein